MSLRRKLQLYLASLHLVAFAIAGYFHAHLGLLFFVIELVLILSLALGWRLVNTALKPLDFVKSFKDLLSEQEFSTRFSNIGQLEMDQLIATYNQMLRELYEERLRLGEQRGFLERFMQVTPVGVLITDFDGEISVANPAAASFLDIELQNLLGRRFSQLQGELAAYIQQLQSGDSELVSLQGAKRCRIHKQSFVDRGFERQFVMIEELTALLNESERAAYEKLIRMMSHEVNNTVASTNSLLESCRTYAPQLQANDQPDYVNALNVVITRNENLNRFVHNFAQVVKLPEPKLRPCDLRTVIGHLEPMFTAQCVQRNIRWSSQWDPSLPNVIIDQAQIEQALINIVKNAMEAIDSNGEIELVVKNEGDHVLLELFDSGCGLDDIVRPELFTPFYTSKSSGQGLGLTLVKEILLRHHFDFGLATATDHRTRFHIKFG